MTRTLARIRSLGHEAVGFPLSERVLASDDDTVSFPEPVCGFIATSANAFSGSETMVPAGYKRLPTYVVGRATADAATDAGFVDIRKGDGDGATLAARIIADRQAGLLPDGTLVYLAGMPRTPALEAALEVANIPVFLSLRYKMIEISYSTDFLNETIFASPLDVVLLYSTAAARRFSTLISGAAAEKVLESARFLCLSPAIGDGLPGMWRDRVMAASEPNEDKLLELAGLMR